jgi:hypothetical protein
MGLFNKGSEEVSPRRQEWLRKKNEKARAALEKYGVDLDGVLLLDDSFDDNGYEYLLVFPDRVEYIAKGKPGLLTRKGRGTEVIPISRVTSVSTRKTMVFMHVIVTASGQTIEFKSNEWMAPQFKEKILELMNSKDSASSTAAKAPDPADQLAKLADLHKAGVLTDEEFASKKADLLKKI